MDKQKFFDDEQRSLKFMSAWESLSWCGFNLNIETFKQRMDMEM